MEDLFSDENTVFILDSYGLIYREYYAFISRPLVNSKHENVSALYGFFRNLHFVLRKYAPKFMLAAMDSRTPTFRHEMYADYKATRQKTPDDLKAQFPMIESLLDALSISVVRCDGFEADDVIATIADECEREKRSCRILSADKDLMQLASDFVHILKPDKTNTWIEIDKSGVQEEWGVDSERLLDLLSLTGDTADNVPGVAGIGQKTAAKLLAQYKNLEDIYAHISEIKGATGKKLEAGKESAFFSRKLIELRFDVPCEKDLARFGTSNLTYARFINALSRYEVPSVGDLYKALMKESGQQTEIGEESKESDLTHASSVNNEENGNTSAIAQNHGDYKAVTQISILRDFIDRVLAQTQPIVAAFDTETDSLNTKEANLVGFSLCASAGEGIYVPLIASDSLLAGSLIGKKDAFSQLARLFAREDVTIVMHNAKFDIEVLWANGFAKTLAEEKIACGEQEKISERARGTEDDFDFDFACALVDTMIAAWVLESDKSGKRPYSLEYLAETKLALRGIEFDEVVTKGKSFADVPLSRAADYAAEDADFTFRLWRVFEQELENDGLRDLFFQTEMPLLPVLAAMEMRGIHLDSSRLNSYSCELKSQIGKIESEIYQNVGHEFNIASPKQLQQVLFTERALSPGRKTKTGFSTDTEVLEELAKKDSVARLILDYRGATKLLSTYVETLPKLADKNGRVHTTFMQTGTATGRLSSKDPNLQNIPVREEAGRKIRAAFTAEEGSVLISADYSQIELVVLAHLSGDKNLCAAFESGIDVHKSTASLVYGVPGEQVDSKMRRNAKTLNFGLVYGMSAFRLAQELSISRTEAAAFIKSYFDVYSGVKDFFDKTIEEAQRTGFVETILGRRREIRAINSKNRAEKEGAIRVAKNSPIQGSAADIVKKAMLSVNDAIKKTRSRARLLLQVHDELILECPDTESEVSDTIALLKDKMEHAVKLNVPLKVSIEHGKSWGEFH